MRMGNLWFMADRGSFWISDDFGQKQGSIRLKNAFLPPLGLRSVDLLAAERRHAIAWGVSPRK